MPDALYAGFTVVRALLQRGRTVEQAVTMFKPYHEVMEVEASTRYAAQQIAERVLKNRQRACAFVNNRLEGTRQGPIEAVVSGLDA